jgi:hypothetical protein
LKQYTSLVLQSLDLSGMYTLVKIDLTEIATQIAKTKKVSADEVFKQLASVPRDKVAEAVKKLV